MWDFIIAAELLVLLLFLAYSNSFQAPFIRDDNSSIPENPSIQHLWPPAKVLSPPHSGETVGGRPVLNLSLALNYAAGGTEPWGYHLVNLLIHAAAGLTLFGVVRRTLLQPRLRDRFEPDATLLALAVAALWALHPLQTESVTYTIQRAESLMGLFYLLTLYFFIRYAEEEKFEIRNSKFEICSVAACLLGMATKEVMASAPIVVMLYDRTFIAGTFRAAWKKRRTLYLALASTWILLGWLVAGIGAAIAIHTISWRAYVTMQFYALVEYLKLTLWPSPLIFDYSGYVIHNRFIIGTDVLLVALLLGFTIVALRRWPAVGFCAFCYFAVLAPTSSVVVASGQTLCDHRMYVPLAPVIAVAVLGIYRWLGRVSLPVFFALALVAGGLTHCRNHDYRTALALWTDMENKLPGSASAHANRGGYLLKGGRLAEAKAEAQEALRIDANNTTALDNLGIILFEQGRIDEAIACFKKSLRSNPDHAWTYYFYGYVLQQSGRKSEAIGLYRQALVIRPTFPDPLARLAELQAGK